MKKTAMTLLSALLLTVSFGCANWNKMTPQPMDNKAIQAEIKKSLVADHLNDVHVSEVHEGVVTLDGTVKNSSDRQKAYDDAAKVNGVKSVINNITIQ